MSDKHAFSYLSLRQLYLFRAIYAVFSVIVISLIVLQIQQDADRLKIDVANDFSDKVTLVDNTILAAQNKALELASLYNSGLILPDALPFDSVIENFIDNQGYFEKTHDNGLEFLWNMIGAGSVSDFYRENKELSSVLYQVGRFLPITLSSEEYPGAVLSMHDKRVMVMSPDYPFETMEKNLAAFGKEDFWANGLHLIKDFELSNQIGKTRWTMPHQSILDKTPVVAVSAPLFNPITGKRSGSVILYVDLATFGLYVERSQLISSEIVLTANHQGSHHILAFTKEFTSEVKETPMILQSPIENQLPKNIAKHFRPDDQWVAVDEDVFLISLPLNNAGFRLSFYTNASNFYFANPNASAIRIASVVLIFIFGWIADFLIRKKFLAPMLHVHRELQLEQQKLGEILEDLKKTQSELVESEKLASLGQLVAGVAHEINTPVGIAVTAVTHGNAHLDSLKKDFESGSLTKSKFQKVVSELEQSHEYVMRNLSRASDLIQNFKQISTDRSTEETRKIFLGEYIEKTIQSLQPQLKRTNIKTIFECETDNEIETVPGAISQVVTNLVLNAAIHAYGDDYDAGEIKVVVAPSEDKYMQFTVTDFGKGMPEEVKNQIFEPFFTTRRGKGGTGLGMSICYNLITQTLKGSISVESEVGKGSLFKVSLPMSIKVK